MAKKAGSSTRRRSPRRAARSGNPAGSAKVQDVLWRVERLERQVGRLSELVRQHASDTDRLVRIVAEDRDILREELLKRTPGSAGGSTADPRPAHDVDAAS